MSRFLPALRLPIRPTLLSGGLLVALTGWPVAPLRATQPDRPAIVAAPLVEQARLHVPGNSRFAGAVSGRDSVRGHLAAMGVDWARLEARVPDFSLGPDELGWLVMLPTTTDSVSALVAARRDRDGRVAALELFVHDEARYARAVPRDDGVQRTSLAAQRNLQQARALHGAGGATRLLAANGARVVALIDSAEEPGPKLVVYRFDPAGRIASLRTMLPLALLFGGSCCSSSGTSGIFASMITPP
jgi:hypothetical protein